MDKYVVFKAEEWEKFKEADEEQAVKLGEEIRSKWGERIDKDDWSTEAVPYPDVVSDAVVLRRQDKFTATALWSYAHGVRNTMETLEEWLSDYPDSDLMYQLVALHDWAMNQAEMADRTRGEGKVPD